MGEVWCYKCDRPAVAEVRIRVNGRVELRGMCSDHRWLLIAPRGRR